MEYEINDNRSRLEARLNDFISASEKGEIAISNFLTPAEQYFAGELLLYRGIDNRSLFWGGYDEAERKRLVLLPSYVSDYGMPAAEIFKSVFAEEYENCVTSLRICGSGFRELTHRDYLGSLLSLGIERDSVGDIAVQNGFSAVVFCTVYVARLIMESLEKIGADKVEVERYVIDGSFDCGKRFQKVSGTVASLRLDCIVAELCGLSREKAQDAVKKGLCELNYVTENKCGREIEVPCIVSVRGFGKYAVREIGNETRRGRIRIYADKYI